MKAIEMTGLGVTVNVPDDPADGKGALICMYLADDGSGGTLIRGAGHDIVPMTLMLLDNLLESLNQEQRRAYIATIGEHLVDMVKDVDGIEAVVIRRQKEDDADENEDD